MKPAFMYLQTKICNTFQCYCIEDYAYSTQTNNWAFKSEGKAKVYTPLR